MAQALPVSHDFVVTIPNGGTENAVGVDLKRETLVGLLMPPAFSGTTVRFKSAGALSGTEASGQAVVYRSVHKEDGTEYSVTVGADQYVFVDPTVMAGVRFLKLVTDAQAAERKIILAGIAAAAVG